MSIDLCEVHADDLIDELESRGYIVTDKESYDDVIDQLQQWKHG